MLSVLCEAIIIYIPNIKIQNLICIQSKTKQDYGRNMLHQTYINKQIHEHMILWRSDGDLEKKKHYYYLVFYHKGLKL